MSGPNQDTLARELQTLIGVDSGTFQHMLQSAKKEKEAEDDAEEEAENESDVDDNDDNGDDADDDSDNDDDDGDDYEDDDEDESEDEKDENEKDQNECNTKVTNHKGKSKSVKQDLTVSRGSGDDPKSHKEDGSGSDPGYEPTGADFMMADAIHEKGPVENPQPKPASCKWKKVKRRSTKRVLLRFLKKLLTGKSAAGDPYLLDKIKEVLRDKLQARPDGLVHVFPKNKKAMYEEQALESLMRGANAPTARFQGSATRNADDSLAHEFTTDDTTLNGPVFRISSAAAGHQTVTPDQSALLPGRLDALSNQMHPQANDNDNKGDAQLQSEILREELGASRLCLGSRPLSSRVAMGNVFENISHGDAR